MSKVSDSIKDAIFQLEGITGIKMKIKRETEGLDAIISIGGKHFSVEYKSEIRKSNKGIFLSQINDLNKKSKNPIVIIAKYIASDVAVELRNKEINYIDIAGNAYLKEADFFIFISGQKVQRISKTNQSRAFQESGIKLIFCLIKYPESLNLSYRNLAKLSEISVGSVSHVIKELIDLSFILKVNKKKLVLKNTSALLNRWIIAYNDILRPRLIKRQMRFSNKEDVRKWLSLPIQKVDDVNLWGGETAGAIITGLLKPKVFTIYTNGSWQNIAKRFKLIPDEQGEIEILSIFWNTDTDNTKNKTVPALLVYADLISSGYERNIQIANELLNNELQYIK